MNTAYGRLRLSSGPSRSLAGCKGCAAVDEGAGKLRGGSEGCGAVDKGAGQLIRVRGGWLHPIICCKGAEWGCGFCEHRWLQVHADGVSMPGWSLGRTWVRLGVLGLVYHLKAE